MFKWTSELCCFESCWKRQYCPAEQVYMMRILTEYMYGTTSCKYKSRALSSIAIYSIHFHSAWLWKPCRPSSSYLSRYIEQRHSTVPLVSTWDCRMLADLRTLHRYSKSPYNLEFMVLLYMSGWVWVLATSIFHGGVREGSQDFFQCLG